MPPRIPKADRYVVEIRDAAGTSLLLTSAIKRQRARPCYLDGTAPGRYGGARPGQTPGKEASQRRLGPEAKAPQKTRAKVSSAGNAQRERFSPARRWRSCRTPKRLRAVSSLT
jgi:hypothetical protein